MSSVSLLVAFAFFAIGVAAITAWGKSYSEIVQIVLAHQLRSRRKPAKGKQSKTAAERQKKAA